MRWGAVLLACMMALAGTVRADDNSPIFGGEGTVPFQVAVNPDTGQPLKLTVPLDDPPLQAAK